MKKIMTISILIVLVAFWTYPCQAGKVVYFAPDGSKITKAEYDRLVAGKADAYQRSKKAAPSKPLKKSSRLAAKSQSKASPGKANKAQPKPPNAHQRGNVSEIRESDVRNITKNMVQSANKRDLQGLIAYLAPSYQVTMKTDQGVMSLTRDEYTAFLKDSWSLIGFYRTRVESEKITIASDKQKATLEAKIFEIATLTNGASVKVRSHQKSIFEIVDEKIMITHTETQEEVL